MDPLTTSPSRPLPLRLGALLACAAIGAGALAGETSFHAKQTDRGINVELSVRSAAQAASPLREAEPAHFTVTLSDETTGTKLAGVYPNVWMVRHAPIGADESKRCSAAVASLLTGGFGNPAALDLNIYYVVALNTDGSITVVDPHFSYGGTQLLGMLQLDAPGYDWTLASDDNRLFVSVPKSNRVAVIDTVRWKLLARIDAGPNPRRVVSGDGRMVWVATERGVAAISAADAKVVATVGAGRGEHDLALVDNFLIATNHDDASATIVDTRRNATVGTVPTGPAPISIAVSPLSSMAYVASADGTVTVIDPKRQKAIATMHAKAGLTQVRMAPGGRFAFLPNPKEDVVQIVDTASNRVIQTGAIDAGPFDVNFSESLAYVRRLRSETVQMVPLAGIGKEGEAVPVVDFPAGEQPFGKAPSHTAAAGIVGAPGESAVIIANPADKHVYYYKEGMAAPIGHFSNYGHAAQAVLVIDRSMKESRGAYATTAVLPAAGDYDVAVFVNQPRVVSCFRMSVAESPALAAKKLGAPVLIEQLVSDRVIPTGAATRLAFRLKDPATQEPREGLTDASILIMQAGGSWYHRQPLAAAERGVYATEFTPPAAGVYYVYVGCPSIGLKTSNPQYLTIEAR
jgi:DNA-binding beta-propeller fold protein YncE